jgi:SAM-dependent methyltransferase
MGILRTLRRIAGTRRDRWRALERRLMGIPAVGDVDFGDLRRTTPLSDNFGSDRGTPIDRIYIEAFLSEHANDVRGRVLEVKDDAYTVRFGGDRVIRSDIVDIDPENPNATLTADLAAAPQLPDEAFDAVIVTQTLQYVYDVRGAISTLNRILKPGGVLLVTVPGVSTVGVAGGTDVSCFWSFTALSLKRLLSDRFGVSGVTVSSHGNVLSAVSFLHGFAAEELDPGELGVQDRDFPVILTGRAVKAVSP